jgi:hypothetical protein
MTGSIVTALTPFYGQVPEQDGWMFDFRYGSSADGSDYTLRSYGRTD